MVKLLLGFSLPLIIAAAVLSFKAKERVDFLQNDLKVTKATLATTKATLAKTEADLKETKGKLEAAIATIAERDAEIAKKKGELEAKEAELTAANATIAEKTAMVATITAERDKLIADSKLPSGENVDVAALKKELDDTKIALAESKQLQEALTQQKQEASDKLVAAQGQVNSYKLGIGRAGLSGQILAFNPGWNFVVLSIGDEQGVRANTQMLVMREGQPIGKVKVTAVEPRTAIADVIPGTMAKGVKVAPGDTVVYEVKGEVKGR